MSSKRIHTTYSCEVEIMNKIILSLFFVLIAFMGIACVSAGDADNCAVDGCIVDSVQSDNIGFDAVSNQRVLMVADNNNVPVWGQANVKGTVSAVNDNASQITVDGNESAAPIKNIVLAKKDDKKAHNFLPKVNNKKLMPIIFDPETGIVKVNPDCPYMHSKYINSTDKVLWTVCADNYDYLKEYETNTDIGFRTSEYHPWAFTSGYNLTRMLKDIELTPYITDGHYKCVLTVIMPESRFFTVDFKFDFVVDQFNNIQYGNLEKTVAHVSGKDITIYGSEKSNHLAALLGIYVHLDVHLSQVADSILDAQKKAVNSGK